LPEEQKKYRKTTKIATPSVGIDGVNHAVRALRAYKEPASYKDLAKGANLHPVYMSQSLSSARDVGLTEYAGKRGLYKLTADGEDYARFLTYGQSSKCAELLRKSILNNPLWSEIIRFLTISEGKPRDPLQLVGDVEGKLGKRWSSSMRNGYANSYTSILEAARLVRVEGNEIVPLLKPEGKPETSGAPSTPALTSEGELPSRVEGYTEFSISDSFKVFVRKEEKSLEFFEDQVKEDSIFGPWIAHEKKKLKSVSARRQGEN